tara:strand:+ start:546 stop:1178 length:633 start_codon:yes stop_codon:yes gene_type:complete
VNSLDYLFENNVKWADDIKAEDANFFEKLKSQHNPNYLWIGCSDSRVPANEIVSLLPGELFVHRNIANLVVHTDLNCLSVLQYAIEVLEVEHIIVCGHYGCGGVHAAYENKEYGLIDNWLRNIKDIYHMHQSRLEQLSCDNEKIDLLCELNVKAQVSNVSHTTILQDAWNRGQKVEVHGWIYNVGDGLLKDLNVSVSSLNQVSEVYRMNS